MFIYNITIKVDSAIADSWLNWMLHEHAPAILDTSCFIKFQVLKILELDDSEGPTYAVQFYASNMDDYNRYINEFSDQFRTLTANKWGTQVAAFRTLMEVVH